MLQWLCKKNLDLKLRTIFCITLLVHVLCLIFIFFIYKYAAVSALVMANNGAVPVVFASCAPSAHARSGTAIAKSSSSRVRKKVVTKKAFTTRKSQARFKSSYPVSSLKDRPPKQVVKKKAKKQEKIEEQTSLFSLAKPVPEEVHEPIPELDPVIEELDDTVVMGEAGEQAQEASFYDTVYSGLSQYWSVPAGLSKGLVAVVIITIKTDGTSMHEFIRTSGVLAFDTAVRTAVLRARYPQTLKPYTRKVEFRS